MADFDHIPVNPENFPESKILSVGGGDFEFLFQKNEEGDFFTVEILKDGVTIITNKVVIRKPFADAPVADSILRQIIPLDLEDELTREERESLRVTAENFGTTVLPVVVV